VISFDHCTNNQLSPMKLFSFVQFRIPAGKITDISENPLNIGALLTHQPFMEALKEATPHFWETITTENLTEEHQKTLYKYYSRWCTRCTPFGRLSGVFTADLSGKTSFREAVPRLYTDPDILEKKKIAGLLNRMELRKTDFREEFIRRFEGEEIPLPEALDPETGIPYGTYNLNSSGELLSQLDTLSDTPASPPHLSHLLLDKYISCLASGAGEITFSPGELQNAPPEENLTSYLFGSLIRKGSDFMFLLKQAGGSSAVNLMARFSPGNTPLAERLRQITAYEQSCTDAILAEVIHMPDGKIGNVVHHALWRTHEIHYLGQSTGTPIPLADLLVSVSGNEVILRSRKFNKRVIPYLSHAHNYTTGLPVYNFLGDLQPAGAQFVFDWGALRDREYLPRVVSGKLILSRATWNLTQKNFERVKETLPRHVVIIEADNELYLDLQQALPQKILQDYLRKNEVVKVQEFLHTPDRCFLPHRASEVVIPVKGENCQPFSAASRFISGKSYPPGSEWLYLKLYTGPKTADNLLREKVRPFIGLLKEKGLIQKWFFIRYHDPGFHLRLRFYHSAHPGFYQDILALFHSHFHQELSSGQIFDFQVATYKPEYSRYPDMETAETLFMQDSEQVLGRLEEEAELYRLETSLTRIPFYLSGLTLPEKVHFCQAQRDAFLQELGAELKPKLNALYRQYQAPFQNILSSSSAKTLPCPAPESRASFIHMHVNRNFISDARKYELMLYHFLFKYYHSLQARKNHS